MTSAAETCWPDRVRLPLRFDPAPLAREALALAQGDWVRHFVPQNYEGAWDALPLRAAAGATHPILMIVSDPSATAFVDTPLMAQAPAIAAAVAAFRCPLASVRLMRLGPASIIKPHRDHDLAAELGWARLHVPITSNPQVRFALNGRDVAMLPGEAWYLRLSDPHEAANHGETDRIHLVLDARMNPWLEAQLAGR
jgi:hypothetical protein